MASSARLTVKAAAVRVKRTPRTIERWIADGLPVKLIDGVNYIRIDQLLAELRKRNLSDPSKKREAVANSRRATRVMKHLERKYDTPDRKT